MAPVVPLITVGSFAQPVHLSRFKQDVLFVPDFFHLSRYFWGSYLFFVSQLTLFLLRRIPSKGFIIMFVHYSFVSGCFEFLLRGYLCKATVMPKYVCRHAVICLSWVTRHRIAGLHVHQDIPPWHCWHLGTDTSLLWELSQRPWPLPTRNQPCTLEMSQMWCLLQICCRIQ